MTSREFPGGSKSRVNKAGQRVAKGSASAEDFAVIDEWRYAHRAVLNTFQASLRMRTRDTDIVVAQRHKRKNTIIDKLDRHPRMKLATMHDVAGCRLIFKDVCDLNKFHSEFHRARFSHCMKNLPSKFDYINCPKATGYRGIHDVYEYNVQSEANAHLKGLLIELQYRSKVQHAWATTVEVIGHITESQPKFERGDDRYQKAMVLASEILSRSHEDLLGPVPELCSTDLVDQFEMLDDDIRLTESLEGINQSELALSNNKNTILIFRGNGQLEAQSYKKAKRALDRLFEIESDEPSLNVVLVRAEDREQVRVAFKNYFSDAKDFLQMLNSGKQQLRSQAS